MNNAVKEATRAQNASAHPGRSTFVSANAGSGKTTILTRRLARLLLAGVEPQSILCLTFTKAASGEVQERIFKILGEWVLLNNQNLRQVLEDIGEMHISDEALSHARQLFAKALETPSGLKVQTIHAFCAGLLRRFPLEANVSPSFREMDDAQAQSIAYQALQNVVNADPELARHIAERRSLTGDLAKELVDIRGAWRADWQAHDFAHHIDPAHDWAFIDEAQFWQNIDEFAGLETQEALLESLKTRHKGKEYIALRREGTRSLALLKTVIFTSDGALKKNLPSPETKYLGEDRALQFAQLLMENFNALHTQNYFQALAQLHRFGARVFETYQKIKANNFLLDYDDLIERADALLSENNRMNWVMYRIDSRISHILVDEAQDTNEAQWRIIDAIASASLEDETEPRTLFVVGDEKQSIFSFQGANPAVFQDRREFYRAALQARAEPLQEEDLLVSFRSSPLILDYVDQVFQTELKSGLGAQIKHEARAQNIPGLIEILPFYFKEAGEQKSGWPEIKITPEERAEQELAERMAQKIRDEIASGAPIPDGEATRAVKAGDYLILVRKRDRFFYAVQKALLEAGVPIAGVDKLKLNQELPVQDILALLRAVASPYDDLSLAQFLRSPLGGLSEKSLYELAHPRGQKTLLEALQSSPHQEALTIFEDIRSKADFLRPHDLIARILHHHNGEAKLRARLGVAASDALQALLDKALDYETQETPSLIGFIGWFEAQDIELRRVLSETENAVRVMTIHGAKGLEADVVLLALNESRNQGDGFLLTHKEVAITRNSYATAPFELDALFAAQKAKNEEEDNRLLYVALTRARARLVICGAGKRVKKYEDGLPETHPYSILSSALENLPQAKLVQDDGTQMASHNWPNQNQEAQSSPTRMTRTKEFPRFEASPYQPKIGLSDLLPELESKGGRGKEYGILFHELMEHLLNWPEEQRTRFAQNRFGHRPAFDEALFEAQNILTTHQSLFGRPALDELTFEINLKNQSLIGRMDHVIVDDEIIIIDYKTDLDIARNWSALHKRYQMQLGVYAEAMRAWAPAKPIRAMIIWSKTGDILEPDGQEISESYQLFLQSIKNTPA